jgi:dihydroorotate dehydrogenase electron transfer subunit
MNRVGYLKIIKNFNIAESIYTLQVELPADYPQPRAGQFVNVYLNDAGRLLPRPLSVCDFAPGVLTLAYVVAGGGTSLLSGYAPGTMLRVSTPLGNGFSPENEKPALLVGGGLGVVPLVYLAKQMQKPRIALGFRSEAFLTEAFPCPADIATEDGSSGFKGNIVEMLRQTDIPAGTVLYACGPKPMLKALTDFAAERGCTVQVSLEERMGCGYGACVGCVCKTKNGNEKVCEDGPVFMGSEVEWDA